MGDLRKMPTVAILAVVFGLLILSGLTRIDATARSLWEEWEEQYIIYDVNGDGRVDMIDCSVTAFFFEMSNVGDDGWSIVRPFENNVTEAVFYTSAEHCDVNYDGKIDVEDIVVIMANFS